MITMRELGENRERGIVPDGPLLVPLVHTPKCNLIPIKINTTDLRAMFGLDVVVAHDGRHLDRVIALADAITRAKPEELTLWNVENGQCISVVSMGKKFIAIVPPREDLP